MAGCVEARNEEETIPEGTVEFSVIWRLDTTNSPLAVPTHFAIHRSAIDKVLIADLGVVGLIVVDAEQGQVLAVEGGEGEDLGRYVAPHLVGASHSGAIVAVYDVGRATLELLDRELRPTRRVAVDPLIVSPKAMVVAEDTVVAIAGGRLLSDSAALGVHWLLPGGTRLFSTGPTAPDGGTPRARQLAAGGPLFLMRTGAVIIADGISGALWEGSPHAARRLPVHASGDPDLIADIDSGSAEDPRTIWWTYPRVIVVKPLGGDRYLLLWSYPDEQRLEFLEVSEGWGARRLAAWKANAEVAQLYDRETVILGGTDGKGGPFVARIRLPESVRRELADSQVEER